MARSPHGSHLVAAALVAALAGGAAWQVLSDHRKEEALDAARRAGAWVEREAKEFLAAGAAAPSSGTPQAPKEFIAHLGGGGNGAPAVDPLLRQVEDALADKGGDKAGDAGPVPEVSGSVSSGAMREDSPAVDPVVGSDFIGDLASYLASCHVPGRNGAQGSVRLSMMKANARYSLSTKLRSAERDPFRAREAVIGHICRAGVLESLGRMYGPALLDGMEAASRRAAGPRGNGDARAADMFSAYAVFAEKAANTLEAAGRVDLAAVEAAVRSAAEKEGKADEEFSRAFAAHAEAMDSGRKAEAAIQGSRMAESSHIAGMYASVQEKAKEDMAAAMRRRASGRVVQDGDLVFLGEWIVRHHVGVEATDAAAALFRSFAFMCSQRAEKLRGAPAGEGSAEAAPAAEARAETAGSTGSAGDSVRDGRGGTAGDSAPERADAAGAAFPAPETGSGTPREASGRLSVPAPSGPEGGASSAQE